MFLWPVGQALFLGYAEAFVRFLKSGYHLWPNLSLTGMNVSDIFVDSSSVLSFDRSFCAKLHRPLMDVLHDMQVWAVLLSTSYCWPRRQRWAIYMYHGLPWCQVCINYSSFFLSLSLHTSVVFLYLVSYPFYEELGNSWFYLKKK